MVIQFLNAKNIPLAKIHSQPVKVHREGVMKEGNVRKRDLDAHLSSLTIQKTGLMLTFMKAGDSLLKSFIKSSHISPFVLYETVTVEIRYRKICARWIPRMLTDEHKQKKVKKQLRIGYMDWWLSSMVRGSSSLCNVRTNV
jgi:hypothetical protein